MPLSKDKVIDRLCALLSEVNTVKFRWSVSSDCICGESDENYRMDEEVLEFVERSVRAKLYGGNKP
jgi:hypothetical protein